jgi:putative thioredoxin
MAVKETLAPQAPFDLIKETTTQAFVKDVIEESKRQPVLIDFWAPWCGPCHHLTPILEKAVRAAKGKVKLVKMNIDDHPAIPSQMGIQSIPAVIAFVNGQPADGFMGAVPESQVTAFIDKLTAGMPGAGEPNIAEILKAAETLLAEGAAADAASVYAEVLALDATNIAALAGLAKCYAATGAIELARQTLEVVPIAKRESPAVQAVQASIDIAEQAKALGPLIDLKQKVVANPLDHQARFDLATALNASGNRAEATTQLLEIVKRDRKWNEDGARRRLVQFFEGWGPTDEATLTGRTRLATVLFGGTEQANSVTASSEGLADPALSAFEVAGTEEDWLAAKEEVLKRISADLLDTPENHMAYIRERLKPVVQSAMES